MFQFSRRCNISREWLNYLIIIRQTRVGYELLDSGRGVEQRVGYHKLISNKRKWDNCFIKYQTLDVVYVEVLSVNPCKYLESIVSRSVSIFGQTAGYRIYTVSREPIRLPEMQYPGIGV